MGGKNGHLLGYRGQAVSNGGIRGCREVNAAQLRMLCYLSFT